VSRSLLIRSLPFLILGSVAGVCLALRQPAVAVWVGVAAVSAVGLLMPGRLPRWAWILLFGLTAALPAVWLAGRDTGRARGFEIGMRYGQRDAGRRGPMQVTDQAHPAAALLALPSAVARGPWSAEEGERFARVLNRAPSPCLDDARRGRSLATSLLDAERPCALSPFQVPLGAAAVRTFGADEDEALAVLRVERRAQPEVAGRPRLGNAEADVVISIFGDFQCPYCQRAEGTLREIREARPLAAVVWKHLPLPFHPAAEPAARAAEAAGAQGRFWDMALALLAMGKGIADVDGTIEGDGPAPYEEVAERLGLDVPRYRRDLRSEGVARRIADDAEEARSLGVDGTPAYFVGDRRLKSRLSLASLDREMELARAEALGHFSWGLEPAPPGAASASP
jgi:protein-disulfide isomerase